MSADLAFRIIRAYSTAWMRSRCRVLLHGEEHLPTAPGSRRVYLLLNHSTSYDLVALIHLAANRFSVVMDEGAFHFPVIGRLFHAAGFIPLVKSDSGAAIRRAVDTIHAGMPVVMSLTDGGSAIGVESRPRTGGVRIANLAGADIYPVFTMVEKDRLRHRSFRGRNGETYSYTTFRDTFYIVSFLPPIPASSFAEHETYESYRQVAEGLKELSDREQERFSRMMREDAGELAGLRRRGGSDRRVRW